MIYQVTVTGDDNARPASSPPIASFRMVSKSPLPVAKVARGFMARLVLSDNGQVNLDYSIDRVCA
jgi:hypothetical protein